MKGAGQEHEYGATDYSPYLRKNLSPMAAESPFMAFHALSTSASCSSPKEVAVVTASGGLAAATVPAASMLAAQVRSVRVAEESNSDCTGYLCVGVWLRRAPWSTLGISQAAKQQTEIGLARRDHTDGWKRRLCRFHGWQCSQVRKWHALCTVLLVSACGCVVHRDR